MRIEAATAPTERRRWLITGQVQGVGFRPFVFRAARRLALQGFVQNGREGVVIEGQGQQPCLDQFEAELRDHHPALARIRTMASQLLSLIDTEKSFRIIASAASDSRRMAEVTADTAVCNACVEEILSQTDRRAGYPLTNCTNCGPRYSIIRKVPYDRNNTTMAGFEMCPTCRAEYLDPADRRFHAQPIACPNCGPQVILVDPQGEIIAGEPIFVAREMLLRGEIIAIKGLGGFHLAVRADDERAVSRLRQLKKRDHKPFAVMAGSIEIARELAELGESAVGLMQSPACPIVLARRRDNAAIASAVAPGSHRLGLMLPYTPIHHLLLRGLPPLVMTSGNQSDEPLAIDNHGAQQRLGPMCDALLLHDRPIQRGVDDSVVIDTGSADPILVRRARGYVPGSIPLPTGSASQGICVGGELKNTVAVVRDQAAILSQHLGDLSHPAAYEAFGKAIDDLQSLFDVAPDWIAHDLHPSYVSTMHARKLAARMGVPAIAIQHHHAHAASLLAEHGLSERILAVVCDGTGYGLDGTIWGGELLAADLNRFERLAHLRPMRLAGGDAAARETARCALSLLHDAFGSGFESLPIVHELLPDRLRRQTLCRMIRDNIACVPSSGAGRVFDGVAAILGLCDRNHYEAQAGLLLESAAQRCTDRPGSYVPLFDISGGELQQIDLSPLIRELVLQHSRGTPVEELSCLLHEQIARAWVAVVGRASERLGLRTVGLTGGVFCNAILTLRLTELLEARNLRVLRHRLVAPNDGGLALGQAAIAATRFANAQGKGGSPCDKIAAIETESRAQIRHHLNVCVAAGCLSSRADQVKDALEKEVQRCGLDRHCQVRGVGCLGLCSEGPLVNVESEKRTVMYQNVTAQDAPQLVQSLEAEPVSRLVCPTDRPFFTSQKKIVLENSGRIDPERIEEYIAFGGYDALQQVITTMRPEEVISEITKSGLRGRGGAGFPTGLKWSTVFKADGSGGKYVICNADEGDPGAFMDRSVLESDPHRVLEGMAIAAYAVGAQQGYIYVRAEYPLAVKRLKIAIRQADRLGLLGNAIFGTKLNFSVDVRLGAGAFVCGEETALIQSVEGKRGQPRPRPPFPAERGLWNCPTLINNVETFANIAPIMKRGSSWFAGIGTEKSKGTKVFAVAGRVANTGLIEVPMGITLRQIIFDVGGGIPEGKKFKAVQTGGPSGGCIPELFLDMPVDYESLAKVGSIMGSGGMIVMDETSSMVDVARFFMDFCKDESCGKCVPCRVGTAQMLDLLNKLVKKQATRSEVLLLQELCDMVRHTSLCGLGQSAPNPVLTTLRYFPNEYEELLQSEEVSA